MARVAQIGWPVDLRGGWLADPPPRSLGVAARTALPIVLYCSYRSSHSSQVGIDHTTGVNRHAGYSRSVGTWRAAGTQRCTRHRQSGSWWRDCADSWMRCGRGRRRRRRRRCVRACVLVRASAEGPPPSAAWAAVCVFVCVLCVLCVCVCLCLCLCWLVGAHTYGVTALRMPAEADELDARVWYGMVWYGMVW